MISSINFSGIKAIKGFSEDVDKVGNEIKEQNKAKGVPTELFDVSYISRPFPQCGTLIATGEKDILELSNKKQTGEIYNQFRFDLAEEAKTLLDKIQKGIVDTITLESKK